MRQILFSLLTIFSINSYGQCTDCTSFEEALKKPESVKTLKINQWQQGITLDSVPISIGKFVNAEEIYLSDHDIDNIPAAIGNLRNLKELSFAGCKLAALPEGIFLLKNLKELILLNNEFSEEYINEFKKRVKEEMPNTKLLISGAE